MWIDIIMNRIRILCLCACEKSISWWSRESAPLNKTTFAKSKVRRACDMMAYANDDWIRIKKKMKEETITELITIFLLLYFGFLFFIFIGRCLGWAKGKRVCSFWNSAQNRITEKSQAKDKNWNYSNASSFECFVVVVVVFCSLNKFTVDDKDKASTPFILRSVRCEQRQLAKQSNTFSYEKYLYCLCMDKSLRYE